MTMEMAGGVGGVSSISVGEFANADWPNSSAYLDMANSFLSGLNTGHVFAPGEPPFNRTIWWTAYSWQLNSPSSKQWMNAVNVAYTEPHGDWWLNTALRNNADFWYISKIGTGGNPGFGAAAGGSLATWVIMSCEVVPSYYDLQNQIGGNGNGGGAFTPWWPVFQGLHNVIGFRTEMLYPDDALNSASARMRPLAETSTPPGSTKSQPTTATMEPTRASTSKAIRKSTGIAPRP